MKKIIILDSYTNEVHVFTLPPEHYDNPKEFALSNCSQDGQTFLESWIDYMVVDLSESEGRLPIYIH